jgi:hypothetical protein
MPSAGALAIARERERAEMEQVRRLSTAFNGSQRLSTALDAWQ